MKHVVLLGDSIFDNAAYVGGGPDVVCQLRAALPSDWRATLNALDGAVIADVGAQLQRRPAEASHLVVSVGGNDALLAVGVLDERARSVGEALDKLSYVRERFWRDYGALLDAVAATGLPAAVCTIYEARFPEPDRRRVAATVLTLLNDCITREAFRRNFSLIDLRLICDSDDDFANPIEPSVRGGAKIAAAMARFVTGPAASDSVVISR